MSKRRYGNPTATLSAEDIQEVRETYSLNDPYKLVQSVHLNTLILGKTGVGKSTLFKCLQDPTQDAERQSVVSQTKELRFQPFTLNLPEAAGTITINLIDTPGLRETDKPGERGRSDETITRCIVDCVKAEVTRLHVLVICISNQERLTKDDKETIKVLKENFVSEDKAKRLPIILCITKSEDKTDEWMNRAETEVKDFVKEMGTDIAINFMGFVDTVNNNVSSKSNLEESYQTVGEMRKQFIDSIIELNKESGGCGVGVDLLPYFSILENEAGVFIKQYIQYLILLERDQKKFQWEKDYMITKGKVLSYNVLYDLSVMSAHFALINDILSMIWNSGITDQWIFEGFSEKVYKNKGSLSLKLDERLNNLPEVKFRQYSIWLNND